MAFSGGAAASVPSARRLRASAARLPGVVHTRLQQRRPAAVRRHAARTAARVLVLLTADIAAVWASVALTTVALALAGAWLPSAAVRAWAEVRSTVPVAVAAAVVLSFVLTGVYARRTGARLALALLRGSALAATLTFWRPLLDLGPASVAPTYLTFTASLWLFVMAGRQLSDLFLGRIWPGARGAPPAVLIGCTGGEPWLVHAAVSRFGRDYRLIGCVAPEPDGHSDVIGCIDDLAEVIDEHGVETVVVADSLSDDDLAKVLDVSLTAGCELLYPASAVKFAGVRPRLIWRQGEPFVELGAPVLKAQELLIKRIVDIIGASIGLVVLSPLFVLLALAVRLDSRGPVFFAQHRAGLGGRRFGMLKFRTMRVGADAEKPALAHLNHTGDSRLFKIPNDPRVTRLGAWLRRWSLDELPQLWNVLRGDMSLVGPRPFFEADLEAYEDHHFRRLSAKPGITGLWQVNGRSAVVDFEEVVRLDREYIERWSLWLDLYILARTVPAVLGRSGAY